jgi:GntR family transcriptional regulator, transcriptional repressor for pyruvate dehydrogenase complex
MFKAIEREETLTCRVTEEVERLILDDLLRPGDKLPAERDLALRFQVSRTVIREAIRSLAARGLVEVRQGKGTTVSAPSVESLSQPLALLLRTNQRDLDHKKVLEVRRVLEIEIAGIAAERRTSSDLDLLEHILEDRSGTKFSREEFVEWDVEFHSALARATQNELFSLLLGSVATVMRRVREIGFDVPGTPERAYAFHRRILDQVTAGHAARARRAMQEHLAESEETILKALKIRK